MNNIVLVHGGFVDGSGWEGVYKILKKDGYNVSIVQNPTLSLDATSRLPSAFLLFRTGQRFSSAIPMVEQ
jgi:hypothetical protein